MDKCPKCRIEGEDCSDVGLWVAIDGELHARECHLIDGVKCLKRQIARLHAIGEKILLALPHVDEPTECYMPQYIIEELASALEASRQQQQETQND